MESLDHIVKINEDDREILIYRVLENGDRELFTSVKVPDVSSRQSSDLFESFALQLGENLLMDSPAGRKIFCL